MQLLTSYLSQLSVFREECIERISIFETESNKLNILVILSYKRLVMENSDAVICKLDNL